MDWIFHNFLQLPWLHCLWSIRIWLFISNDVGTLEHPCVQCSIQIVFISILYGIHSCLDEFIHGNFISHLPSCFTLYATQTNNHYWIWLMWCIILIYLCLSHSRNQRWTSGSLNMPFPAFVCAVWFKHKQHFSQVFGTLRCSSASAINMLHFDWGSFYGSIATIAW